MYEYAATVVAVVDGDTIHCEVDLGMDVSIRTTLRFAELNAAEHGTKEGDAATVWLERMLPPGKAIVIRTIKDRREKYGRYLAYVYLPPLTAPAGGSPLVGSLNQMELDAGQAVPYHGGKR